MPSQTTKASPGRGWKTVQLAALTVYTILIFGLIKMNGLRKRLLGLFRKTPAAE